MALDRDAALRSTSWGLFQIMGLNHQRANFNSVDEMINAMSKTEAHQLRAFAKCEGATVSHLGKLESILPCDEKLSFGGCKRD